MAIGKVIKGDGSSSEASLSDSPRPALRPPRAGVVNSEEFEARNDAKGIIQQAQEKARQILADAEAKRDAKLADGREEGRQEGLASVTDLIVKAKIARDEMLASVEP